MRLDRRRLLLRGARGRCPVCGGGRCFERWDIKERCPTCEFEFERIEGHWIGSIGLNTIVSFTTLFLVLAIGFIVTVPDIPVVELTVVAVVVALVMPVLFHPVSKTLWTAIDLCMRPLEPGEVAPGWEIEASVERPRSSRWGRPGRPL